MMAKSGTRIRIDKVILANGDVDESVQNVVLEGAQDRVAVARVLVQEVLETFEQAIEEIM
jgi:5S rRNA maturation endonuclease (ribonuclease M5)|eukprot:COSAG03_NODE_804_length_5790_cov_54.606923_6_plen_60_part_00